MYNHFGIFAYYDYANNQNEVSTDDQYWEAIFHLKTSTLDAI